MKDNYSWLDDLVSKLIVAKETAVNTVAETLDYFENADLVKPANLLLNRVKLEAKQTIISQIEIEKLRARIVVLRELHDYYEANITSKDNLFEKFYKQEEADLTEKLKELEK